MALLTDLYLPSEDDPTPGMNICGGVTPTLTTHRDGCKDPDYATWMYPVPCDEAGCLFDIAMWDNAREALARFVAKPPKPDATSTAKRLWVEWVGEYIGRAVWSTNVRLRSRNQAVGYIRGLTSWMTARGKTFDPGPYLDKLDAIPDGFELSTAWHRRYEQQAYDQYPLEKNTGNRGLVTSSDFYDWGTDAAATSAFYAQRGTFIQVAVFDTRKRPSSFGGKLKRAMKKISPVRPAPAGKAPRFQRHFILSADSTISYLISQAREILATTYGDMVASATLRWYVCFEAAYNAGLIDVCGDEPDCDPRQRLKQIGDEIRKIQGAKNQAAMDEQAARVENIPSYGRAAAKLIRFFGRISNRFAASGVAGVPCPPAPFLRSSDRGECSTLTTVGEGGSETLLKVFRTTGVAPMFMGDSGTAPPPSAEDQALDEKVLDTPAKAPTNWPLVLGVGAGLSLGLVGLVSWLRR
jgi:hypothetical protein